MVAISLVLPMGWVNNPPRSQRAQTLSRISQISAYGPPCTTLPPHHLDTMDVVVPLPTPNVPVQEKGSCGAVELPDTRDPSLPTTGDPLHFLSTTAESLQGAADALAYHRPRFSSLECRGLSQ